MAGLVQVPSVQTSFVQDLLSLQSEFAWQDDEEDEVENEVEEELVVVEEFEEEDTDSTEDDKDIALPSEGFTEEAADDDVVQPLLFMHTPAVQVQIHPLASVLQVVPSLLTLQPSPIVPNNFRWTIPAVAVATIPRKKSARRTVRLVTVRVYHPHCTSTSRAP